MAPYDHMMAEEAQDRECLLAEASNSNANTNSNLQTNATLDLIAELKYKYRSLKYLTYFLIILYATLVIVYIILVKTLFEPREALCGPGGGDLNLHIFPSLRQSGAVTYERRTLDAKLRNNPFSGKPRPQLDAAWHDMFENIRIKVPKSDLDFYNLSSVPMADGSGYAAELGVHHELHCLKKIRHFIHREYYLVNETEAEMVEWDAHVDHCIEFLRLASMCRGDPSLSTFKWVPRNPPAEPAHLTAVAEGWHQCVNWESLMGWVKGRAVPIFEEGVLERPQELGE